MQTGEVFRIFQDDRSISFGQPWKDRIEVSLDAVTFLVPIITPGFFKRDACRYELERFLDREKELGRADLILPIYYVDCSLLNDEQRRADDHLAQAIASRQYTDWRGLRFEPFTSPDVRRALAAVAQRIAQVLEERTAVASPEASPEIAEKGRASLSIRTKELKPSAGAPDSERHFDTGLAVRKEPPTRIVDALHRGDHATLTEALQAASPGDRILVRPGQYKEGVVIDKPVEIVGDGDYRNIVFEASESSVIKFGSNIGRIANLTLRQKGSWNCVDITQGHLDLEGCDISSRSSACVVIYGGALPRLRLNQIHGGGAAGIFLYENARGTIEDNEIFGNALSGVEISDGADPILRRNRIYNGKSAGIFLYGNARGFIEDNEIFGNQSANLVIMEESDPVIRRNRIHGGKVSGIFIHSNGRGTLEDNEISGNAFAGVEIKAGADPILRRNRIHTGKQSGVFVHTSGRGTLEDNEIHGNGYRGVEITTKGSPIIRRNRLYANRGYAIRVRTEGGAVIEDNDLRGSKLDINIAKECMAKVKLENNQTD